MTSVFLDASLKPETQATQSHTQRKVHAHMKNESTFLASSRDYRSPRYGSLGCLLNTAIPEREKRAVTKRKLTTCFHGITYNLSGCLEKDGQKPVCKQFDYFT